MPKKLECYIVAPMVLPLRPNVCMIVLNRDGRLFLGERAGEPGVWQFPQGGVEPELTLEENVMRELEEEIGVPAAAIKILRKLNATNEYDFQVVPEPARGKWRGQSQTFWLVRFSGTDDQIKLDAHTPEFTAWRWCTVDEVRTSAEPKRRPGYEPALREVEQFLASGTA